VKGAVAEEEPKAMRRTHRVVPAFRPYTAKIP